MTIKSVAVQRVRRYESSESLLNELLLNELLLNESLLNESLLNESLLNESLLKSNKRKNDKRKVIEEKVIEEKRMHKPKGKDAEQIKIGNMLPGQDLVVAGMIAQTGVKKAAEYSMERLRQYFTDTYIESAVEVTALLPKEDAIWKEAGADAFLLAGEGGIFACLWELSGIFQKGFTIELQEIPVRQSSIELCEVMGLNPYRLESGECAVFTSQNGHDSVRLLESRGIAAAWIGKVEKGIQCRILNHGIEGFLERPKPDELQKIMYDIQKNL